MPKVEASGAIRKSLESLGLGSTDYDIRKVRSDDEVLVYQLAEVIRYENVNEVGLKKIQAMVYDRASKTARCETDLYRHDLMQAFELYKEQITASEVRKFVSDTILAAHGVLAHPTGGVYFVPVQSHRMLEGLEHVIDSLHNDSFVFSLGVVDHAKSKKNMLRVFLDEITSEMEALEEDVADVTNPERKGVRESTLKRRVQEFKRVRAKAQTYADLLHFRQEDLLKKVGELEGKVKRALDS